MSRWIPVLYATLLHLYPRAFRERFDIEMQYVFAQVWNDVQQTGNLNIFLFCIREFSGLIFSIIREQLMKKRDEVTFFDRITRPKIYLPLLLVITCLIALPVSLNYWGYVFQPPASPITSVFARVDNIRFVQFDADYHIKTLPSGQINTVEVEFYPPTRILPVLKASINAGSLTNQPPDAALSRQIAGILRKDKITVHDPYRYFSQPRPCKHNLDNCYVAGYELQDDGTLIEINPINFSDRISLQTTVQHDVDPNSVHYYMPLTPAGFLVEGIASDGQALVLFNLSVNIGNDHFAYHEYLFEPDNNRPEIREHIRYNFDYAGLEGLTFPVIAPVIFAALLTITLALIVVFHAGQFTWRVIRR